MIDRTRAREIVEKAINENYDVPGDQLVILDDATIEEDFGWVFFYSSRKFLETGDEQYLIAGNAPVIVSRDDGSLEWLGTALPVEDYVAEYKRRRMRGHVQ